MSEWQQVKLKDYIEKVIDNRGRNPPYVNVGHPVIETGAISGNNKFPDMSVTKKYVDDETYNTWFRAGHPLRGDVLIITVGNGIGSCSIFNSEGSCITQNLIGLRPKKNELSSEFLFYYLNQDEIYAFLQSLNIGSAQPSLKVPHVLGLDIPLPTLPEQQAIASVLSSLDDKIDLLHRQNKTLEAMAETLFRQWFIEEAKEDWEIGKLPDEFTFIMGQSPSGSSFNEEKIGVPMFQGNADFNFRFPTNRVYTTEPKRFAEPLDTLISVRAPVGAQNMAKEKCCIGRGVATFRSRINPDWYTYTYYKLNFLMTEIKKFNDEGTVFGSISKSDFEKIEVIIPDNLTVENFEKVAKPVNDKIISNVSQIQTLASLRDTLLPKLMSAEIRVQH